jgi:hypothetical protein
MFQLNKFHRGVDNPKKSIRISFNEQHNYTICSANCLHKYQILAKLLFICI